MGEVPDALMHDLQDFLASSLPGTEWEVHASTVDPPTAALNPTRNQFNSTLLLQTLRSLVSKEHRFCLFVTDVDLYADDLNFVFGEAELGGRFATVSVSRLRPEFHGEARDEELVLRRLRKEAIHEMGHVLGLRHCGNPFCVMHFSNTLSETDLKSEGLCRSCETILKASLDFSKRFLRYQR